MRVDALIDHADRSGAKLHHRRGRALGDEPRRSRRLEKRVRHRHRQQQRRGRQVRGSIGCRRRRHRRRGIDGRRRAAGRTRSAVGGLRASAACGIVDGRHAAIDDRRTSGDVGAGLADPDAAGKIDREVCAIDHAVAVEIARHRGRRAAACERDGKIRSVADAVAVEIVPARTVPVARAAAGEIDREIRAVDDAVAVEVVPAGAVPVRLRTAREMDRHVGAVDHAVAVEVGHTAAPGRTRAVGEMDREIRPVDDAVAVEVADSRLAERHAFGPRRKKRTDLRRALRRRCCDQSAAGRRIATGEGPVEELESAVGRGTKPRAALAATALDPKAAAIDLDVDAADARREADAPKDLAGPDRHADRDEALSASDRRFACIRERVVGQLLGDAVEHRGEPRRVGCREIK